MPKIGFRGKIFISYLLTAALLTGGFSVAAYRILTRDLYRKTEMTMRSNLSQVQYAVERQLDDMVRAALYLSYSTQARDLLYQLGTAGGTPEQEQQLAVRLRKQMGDLTYYLPSLTKVALFNSRSGLYLAIGVSDDLPAAVQDLSWNADWYEGLISPEEEGSFSVVRPSPWSDSEREVLSYYRRVINEYETQYAICEVQVPLLAFTRLLDTCSFEDLSLYLVDGEGIQLYPNRDEVLPPEAVVTDAELSEEIPEVLSLSTEVTATGWRVVAVNHMTSLRESLRSYRLMLAALSLLILLFMGVFFLIALRYFTRPLQRLVEKVRSITWQDMEPSGFPQEPGDLSYLNALYGHLIDALRQSVQKLSAMESEQKRAQYVALTAKMNPHFLYNALATISAADTTCERGTVSEMCCLLSDMLRYSTTQSSGPSTLRREMDHAARYLRFVQWSSGGDLTWSVALPPEMEDLPVPALVLQPLTENCIRHGFSGKMPPYQICLSASRCGERNQVEIADNGVGFFQEAADQFQRGRRRWLDTGTLDEQFQYAVSGKQTLLNVFIRLPVFAGTRADVELDVSPCGGALVRLLW